METVFIINPVSGNGKYTEKLINGIKEAGAKMYITKGVGDGTSFVKEYLKANGPTRFIACGGDGTLNEVLNGAMDCDGAEVGVVPIGTGNDFVRNIKDKGDFFDVVSHINGETEKCDVIKYRTVAGGKERVGYCMNMFNIGFDCNVGDMKGTVQKYPFVSGHLAYLISIFVVLIKKKGANLIIEIDGKEIHRGPLLLTAIANGRFCGGGIMSNPLASITDGFMNFNLIYNISRIGLLKLLPHYMKGTHINLKNIEKLIYNTKCKRIVLTPLSENFRICCDGEIYDAGVTEFEILPKAVNFVIPKVTVQGGNRERTYNTK